MPLHTTSFRRILDRDVSIGVRPLERERRPMKHPTDSTFLIQLVRAAAPSTLRRACNMTGRTYD